MPPARRSNAYIMRDHKKLRSKKKVKKKRTGRHAERDNERNTNVHYSDNNNNSIGSSIGKPTVTSANLLLLFLLVVIGSWIIRLLGLSTASELEGEKKCRQFFFICFPPIRKEGGCSCIALAVLPKNNKNRRISQPAFELGKSERPGVVKGGLVC